MSALLHCFRLGWRQGWAERIPLVSVFSSQIVIVGLWASLWHAASAKTLAAAGMTTPQAIWYTAMAEIIWFSGGALYQAIEQDVQSGEATSFLLRPVSYAYLKLAEAAGGTVFRLSVFAPLMGLFAFLLTGEVPPAFATILIMAPMMLAGAFLWLMVQLLVGFTSAWLPVVRPAYMVVSKISMVLGGLIVPVAFYPAAVRGWAYATPCPAMFYAAAGLMTDGTGAHIVRMILLQLAWLAGLAMLAMVGARLFERRLIANEG